jgi:hypothetical protein
MAAYDTAFLLWTYDYYVRVSPFRVLSIRLNEASLSLICRHILTHPLFLSITICAASYNSLWHSYVFSLHKTSPLFIVQTSVVSVPTEVSPALHLVSVSCTLMLPSSDLSVTLNRLARSIQVVSVPTEL